MPVIFITLASDRINIRWANVALINQFNAVAALSVLEDFQYFVL